MFACQFAAVFLIILATQQSTVLKEILTVIGRVHLILWQKEQACILQKVWAGTNFGKGVISSSITINFFNGCRYVSAGIMIVNCHETPWLMQPSHAKLHWFGEKLPFLHLWSFLSGSVSSIVELCIYLGHQFWGGKIQSICLCLKKYT